MLLLVTGDLVQDDPSGYVHIRRVFGHLACQSYAYLEIMTILR